MRRVLVLRLLAVLAMLPGSGLAAPLETSSGTVELLTRVETRGAEAEPLLLVRLVDGSVFAFPGLEHLPAGRGVEVEIDYRPSDDPGRVPEACAARLLGVPISVDGKDLIQPARRPVLIFESESPGCH